jgi:hypothetical protein
MNTFFHFCLLLLIVICSLCIKAAAKVRLFFGLAKFSVNYFCSGQALYRERHLRSS